MDFYNLFLIDTFVLIGCSSASENTNTKSKPLLVDIHN